MHRKLVADASGQMQGPVTSQQTCINSTDLQGPAPIVSQSGYDGTSRKNLRPRSNHRAFLAISEASLLYTPETTAV